MILGWGSPVRTRWGAGQEYTVITPRVRQSRVLSRSLSLFLSGLVRDKLESRSCLVSVSRKTRGILQGLCVLFVSTPPLPYSVFLIFGGII